MSYKRFSELSRWGKRRYQRTLGGESINVPQEVGQPQQDDGNSAHPILEGTLDSPQVDVYADSTMPTDGSSSAGMEQDDDLFGSAEDLNQCSDEVAWDGDEPSDCDTDEGLLDWRNALQDRPIYAGAPVSVNDSMLMVMSLMLKHNLTASCVEDVLSLLKLHCKTEEQYSGFSLYHFRKYFSLPSNFEFVKEYYCSNCSQALNLEELDCRKCEKRRDGSYFLRLPIAQQMQSLFLKEGFYRSLQERFARKQQEGFVSDVWEGSLYQSHSSFFAQSDNLSFVCFWDGVPVFKSSGVDFWPFCLRILELPAKVRNKPENTIVAGLWFGKAKPDPNLLLGSLQKELKSLYKGKHFKVQGLNEPIYVRAMLLTGTADLPAKADLLNINHHNGQYGCPTCETKGETCFLPTGGHMHVYPYQEELVLRSQESMIDYATIATRTNVVYRGVKGPTELSKIMPNFVEGMAIEPMHCVYEGNARKLAQLWFESKYSTQPFSLRPMVNVIDQRLKQISPPKFVHRMTRSVSELCHWKASELFYWAFYWSIVVLFDIMKPEYFENYLRFVSAVALLNSQCVSQDMIGTARELLHQFVKDFEKLYGMRHCTLNVHQLLHLPDKVRSLGPLWVHSCFTFENMNGKMIANVHGTSHLDTQLAYSHLRKLQYFVKFQGKPEGPVKDFLTGRKKQVKITEEVVKHCYAVGSYTHLRNFTGTIGSAARDVCSTNNKAWKYHRLLKNDLLYVGESYGKTLQTNSSYVVYSDKPHFGKVLSFLKVGPNCECRTVCTCDGKHYAVIQKLESNGNWVADGHPEIVLRHVFKCYPVLDVICIPVEHLLNVCLFLSVLADGQLIVATRLNEIEPE